MFMSTLTGECGNRLYVLKNLIQRDYMGKLFLNLKWERIG